MSDTPEPKRPPWELELEAEVLAEERARQEASKQQEAEEAHWQQAEEGALLKVEHQQVVAEFDALLAARKEELDVLKANRVGARRAGPFLDRRDPDTVFRELAAVGRVQARRTSPLVIIVFALGACLLFWLVGYVINQQMQAALELPSTLMEESVESTQQRRDMADELQGDGR